MNLKAFSIFDVKSDTYSAPFFKATVGLAMREFGALVADKNSWPGKYPGDFKLVEIGVFDDQSGRLSGYDVPVSLGFGVEFIEKAEVVSVPRKVG